MNDEKKETRGRKPKLPEEKYINRIKKTISLTMDDAIKIKAAEGTLGLNASEYIRVLLNRDGAETLTKLALEMKSQYEIEKAKVEKLRALVQELEIQLIERERMLKRYGIQIDK